MSVWTTAKKWFRASSAVPWIVCATSNVSKRLSITRECFSRDPREKCLPLNKKRFFFCCFCLLSPLVFWRLLWTIQQSLAIQIQKAKTAKKIVLRKQKSTQHRERFSCCLFHIRSCLLSLHNNICTRWIQRGNFDFLCLCGCWGKWKRQTKWQSLHSNNNCPFHLLIF